MRISHATLARARANAESLMTDTCRITRAAATSTDPHTGLVSTKTETVYEGPCKVQTAGGLASENLEGSAQQAMGAVSMIWMLYLHLPYGTRGLQANDLATITSSTDPDLPGRRYRLISPQSEKTWNTAHRWNVKEDA